MNAKNIFIVLVLAGILGAGGYGLYRTGLQQGMKMSSPSLAMSTMTEAKPKEKKVLYWHDPMVPAQRFDKPGKSPFMDMELEPVYADEGSDTGTVSISPRVQQNLGVRTAEVIKGALAPSFEAVGNVDYNERDLALVQARSNGFIEKLYVRAALDPVRKGQALAEIYVPDWVAAQEEYLSVQRMALAGQEIMMETLRAGAQQRMRLAGMNEEQVRQVESSGKVQARTTITAPTSGVVSELIAREGMTVMAGAPLFRINGLSTVWVNAEIPESYAGQVRPGSSVEASAAGRVFKGRIGALLPEVNATTRTLKARIELANKNMALVPGMFVKVGFAPSARSQVLLVPTEAVIQTGKRSVVMVAQEDGKFVPTDVEVGTETNGQTEIRKGLKAGQKVVISGQFLLDSEASLKGTTTRMEDTPTSTMEPKMDGMTDHGDMKDMRHE